MGFLLGMHATAGANQSTAIYREDLFYFARIHEDRRAAGHHKFQRRPVLFGGLERGECRSEHPSVVYFPKQQRLQPYAQRRQLFLGHAYNERLRSELSFKLLRHGDVVYE